MTTTELKDRAFQLGAIPTAYGRDGLIEAIERVQPTVVDQPLSTDDEIELGLLEAPTYSSICKVEGKERQPITNN